MTGQHCIAAAALPPIHKDPFDRMLIGQALSAARVKLIISATRAQNQITLELQKSADSPVWTLGLRKLVSFADEPSPDSVQFASNYAGP